MTKYDVQYKAVEDDSQIDFKIIYEVEADNHDEAVELAEDKLWATFLLSEYSIELDKITEKANG